MRAGNGASRSLRTPGHAGAEFCHDQTMADVQYKAFISYNHADARWAQWLHRALERYRVPARLLAEHRLAGNRLHPIFRDRDELSTSSSLSESIRAALAASQNLIVVCSPSAAASRWVNEEIKAFKALGRGERIFCLIVGGADGTMFPPALADDEPLGADLRPHADGRHDAKLKIIAALLDIPFGDLKDREQRRRARVFAIAAAASIALAGVMTALAISAVLAGREAERSRALAAQSLEDAESVAAFLSTMLADIDPEAMGKTIVTDLAARGAGAALPPEVNGTDTARRVLDEHLLEKATRAVQTQFVAQPRINARLDASIGASYHAIGLYPKAVERYAHARDLYRAEFGAADPQTLDAGGRLAMAHFFGGALDKAAAEYEAVLQTSREAHGRDSVQALSAMNGLAMTYVDLERLPEARALLEQAAPATAKARGPEHPDTLDVNNNLGWTLYASGDHAAAEKILAPTLEAQRRVHGPQAPQTLSTLNNLALTYRALGRLGDAEAAHREEWAISRRVMGDDHPEVLISMLNLGRVLYSARKLDEARALLADALAKAEVALVPVHPLRAAISTAAGEVALAQGRRAEARTLFLQTRRIYEQMFEPGHPRFEKLDELLAEAGP
jgi:Tfp pilus assembly protein PilF